MAICGPKAWVNFFGKMSIFRLCERFFLYSLERRLFALEYPKKHFPGIYFIKTNVQNMAIFAPKP